MHVIGWRQSSAAGSTIGCNVASSLSQKQGAPYPPLSSYQTGKGAGTGAGLHRSTVSQPSCACQAQAVSRNPALHSQPSFSPRASATNQHPTSPQPPVFARQLPGLSQIYPLSSSSQNPLTPIHACPNRAFQDHITRPNRFCPVLHSLVCSLQVRQQLLPLTQDLQKASARGEVLLVL